MKHYQLHLNVNEFPPVLQRGHHVLVFLQNSAGEYILANKDIYPKGISRMLGGGMDKGEDPAVAASRELEEETGLKVPPAELTPLIQFTAHITDATDDHVTFITYLYYYNIGEQIITPQDDIKGVTTLSEEKYFELLHRYEQLPKTIDEKRGFAWYDYGQFYGFVHRAAINELRLVSLPSSVLQK